MERLPMRYRIAVWVTGVACFAGLGSWSAVLMASAATGPAALVGGALLGGLLGALLVGDLNTGPAVARRITGMRPLVSGATFPAHAPVEQLDHVLARGDVGTVRSCRIHALPLSDHRAMSVDLA